MSSNLHPGGPDEWQETGADTPVSIALRRIIRSASERDIARPVDYFAGSLETGAAG